VYIFNKFNSKATRGRRDRMVVGFKTTNPIHGEIYFKVIRIMLQKIYQTKHLHVFCIELSPPVTHKEHIFVLQGGT
jgi:hypothetical protein